MTSRWFMPVSTTAHVFYCTSVFKETGVFVMFAFLGRVSYASWQVLPFICWTHVTTQRGACWRIEINSLTHCTKIIIPCKQLISPTPNERQTSASNRSFFSIKVVRCSFFWNIPSSFSWRFINLPLRGEVNIQRQPALLSYGCTQDVAKHERSVRATRGDSQVQLHLLECLANLPSASITQ